MLNMPPPRAGSPKVGVRFVPTLAAARRLARALASSSGGVLGVAEGKGSAGVAGSGRARRRASMYEDKSAPAGARGCGAGSGVATGGGVLGVAGMLGAGCLRASTGGLGAGRGAAFGGRAPGDGAGRACIDGVGGGLGGGASCTASEPRVEPRSACSEGTSRRCGCHHSTATCASIDSAAPIAIVLRPSRRMWRGSSESLIAGGKEVEWAMFGTMRGVRLPRTQPLV